MSYFLETPVNIIGNHKLREPQVSAYLHIKDYFEENPHGEALAVLPTGTGKTGVALISPYDIADGRVLIITPGLVTNDAIKKSALVLQDNFWVNYDIIFNPKSIPVVTEYTSGTLYEHLYESNFVHCNIQKIVGDREGALINRVSKNFFDMIIIDEAHHAPAQSWKNVLSYFKNAKKLHLTGTPYRGDGVKVPGKLIHETKLSTVMRDKYVKLLRKETISAEKLFFTLPERPGEQLDIQAVLEIKDTEWIEKSVALSEKCSKDLICHSLKKLNELRDYSPDVPHKILAVGCSIKHAEDLYRWYKEFGAESVIIHSEMEDDEQRNAFRKIELNQCQVVISVNMLMEGYDHKYLSILSIFRPYRSENAFAQVVGRVLRAIPENEITKHEVDNNALVIFHEETGLNNMWSIFQKEVDRANTKPTKEIHISDKEYEQRENNIASVDSIESFVAGEDSYLVDLDCHALFEKARNEILERKNERERKLRESGLAEEDIAVAVEALVKKDTDAKTREIDPLLIEKRPAEAQKKIRKLLTKTNEDSAIDLLSDFGLDPKGSELYPVVGHWVPRAKNTDNNDSLIVRYVNAKLYSKFGSVQQRDNKTLLASLKYMDKVYDEISHMLETR